MCVTHCIVWSPDITSSKHTQSSLLFEKMNERKNKDVFGASESIVQNGLCDNIATHTVAFFSLRFALADMKA